MPQPSSRAWSQLQASEGVSNELAPLLPSANTGEPSRQTGHARPCSASRSRGRAPEGRFVPWLATSDQRRMTQHEAAGRCMSSWTSTNDGRTQMPIPWWLRSSIALSPLGRVRADPSGTLSMLPPRPWPGSGFHRRPTSSHTPVGHCATNTHDFVREPIASVVASGKIVRSRVRTQSHRPLVRRARARDQNRLRRPQGSGAIAGRFSWIDPSQT